MVNVIKHKRNVNGKQVDVIRHNRDLGESDLKFSQKDMAGADLTPKEKPEQEKSFKDMVKKKEKMSEKDKLLEPFKAPLWDEKTVNLATRRINARKITPSEIFNVNKLLMDGEGVALTKEHQKKGFDWLESMENTQRC